MKKGTGKAPTTTISTTPVRTGGGGFNANMLAFSLFIRYSDYDGGRLFSIY